MGENCAVFAETPVSRVKVLCVAGARPNFMKIAPLIHSMAQSSHLSGLVVHTGQHYDREMSSVFFEDLGIPEPLINLGVGSGSRETQIDKIMDKFAPVVTEQRPGLVLVVGDVNSTIACARVARSQGVPVAHVEAGLRSFDSSMPEELNRVETDQVSDYLFVTEPSGMTNLAQEGVPGKPFLVGNVMIDSLQRQLARARKSTVAESLGVAGAPFFVGTFHRPSNVDDPTRLNNVLQIIEYVADHMPIVLPLHPRTRRSLDAFGLMERLMQHPSIRVCDPIGYIEFVSLLRSAVGVVTDSGGIQEETTYLQTPCITMRDNTERPITVDVGSNILAGTDPEAVKAAIDQVLSGRVKHARVPDLWDGHAADRIVEILQRELVADREGCER